MGMSIAPHVAGWTKQSGRFGWTPPFPTVPGPAPIDGGTGDLIGLKVELFINSAWTDITPYVYYRAGTTKIPITRGRQDEVSQTPPQTATIALNNRDGRFSPRNPTGPYYGQLTKNTPIRISRFNNGVQRFRFYGEVPDWSLSTDISGVDVITTVPAAGMLRRLSQGNKPIRSAMFRVYTIGYSNSNFAVSSVLLPTAYWPCEDGANATQIASGLAGGTAMVVAGTPTFANSTAFPGSASLPLLSKSTWSGTVPAVSSATACVLRFLLSIPSGGAVDGAVVARMSTTGTVARLDLVYNTASSGTLTMIGYNAFGTQLFTSSSSAAVTGVNALPMIVSMELTPDPTPGTVDWTFDYIPVNPPISYAIPGGTVSGSLGHPTQVSINPGSTINDTAIGHIACQAAFDALGNTIDFAMLAWTGEVPTTRFTRICGEQGIPAVVRSVSDSVGDGTTMGYQTLDTFPTLLQHIADALFLPVYEARDQLALVLRNRATMYNQAAHLTLDMSLNQLSAPLVPRDDDALLHNDITVNRTNGSSYEAILTSGANSTQPPPNGIGVYDTSYQLNLAADSLLADQAGWRLHFATVDEPRYPQVSLNLRHPQFTTNVDLLNAALTVDIGDRIVIKNAPTPEYPPGDISLIVQGYSEVLGTFEHDIVFNCTPESPWHVGLLDDAVLGHLDTDGSTLAVDYPLGTETSLSIATTGAATGSPLWATSVGDFPFDVNIGGERVTVTNITGAASPQTFTVTRSVNGVVKSQTHNTDVRLWQPLYLSV